MKRGLKFISIFICSLLLVNGVIPRGAFAEGKYDIKEMTPEVKSALENRRERFNQLKDLKSKGIVGENNRGYVEVLSNDSSSAGLVEQENSDRRLIYKTIESQNNLSGALGTIEKVFAQVQRDKASSGDKIQTEDGQWVAK